MSLQTIIQEICAQMNRPNSFAEQIFQVLVNLFEMI